MQMSLEEAIGYVAADELIEASFLFLILQILRQMCFILLEISGLVLILLSWNVSI
jgi:hypothetical protein